MVIEWQVEYVQVANIGPVAEIKNIIFSFTAQMETVYLSYVLFSYWVITVNNIALFS